MSRDIKFRAWIIDENKMSYQDEWFSIYPFSGIQYADQGYYTNNCDASDEHKEYLKSKNIPIEDDFILMQWTGLKDKNNKDIYEGDICHIFTDKPEPIVFINGAFGYNDSSGSFISFAQNMWFFWANSNSKKIEVIGNIYENPELLPITQ